MERSAVKAGGIISGPIPPLGNKHKRENDRTTLEVDPQGEKVVKLIFREFLSGESLKAIVRKLNKIKAYKASSKPWTVAAVRLILRRDYYATGLWIYGRIT